MAFITMFGLPAGVIPSLELANKVLKERVPHSRLTIIGYHGHNNPNTGKAGTHHYWKVECECGNGFVVRQANIMNLKGHTISCGCYHKEISVIANTTHGDGNRSSPHSALYTSWDDMKRRAEERTLAGDECLIHPDWEDYEEFKEWSLSNGWQKKMVICRNGDTGNYEPDNCRWDSQKSNVQEGCGYICKIVSPDGVDYITTNGINDWCRENQLILPQHIKWKTFSDKMSNIASGRRLEPYYGWTCEFISRCNDK